MNYIEHLTEKEIKTVCNIISGKGFKKLFEKEKQNLSKIIKGFRAETLEEDRALYIAKNNIKNKFISDGINSMLENILIQIQTNIAALKEKGIPQDDATASALLDSNFANNIELYFKLIGDSSNEDAYSMIHEKMKNIDQKRSKEKDISEQLKKLEIDNQSLASQLEEANKTINSTKAEYEKIICEINKTNSTLQSLLDEANSTIDELQAMPSASPDDDADYLIKFDDTNLSLLPSDNTTEITSLCTVFTDYYGKKWLKRCADLNSKGRYYSFHKNEDIPPNFENRELIFHFDGPDDNDFYGLWTWSSIPNDNDPTKDYVQSKFDNRINAIEIITITEARSLDDLIHILKTGIEYTPHSRKVIFSIFNSKGKYTGVLCASKDYNIVNDKLAISENCSILPVYEFSNNDIIHFDNGISFYQNAFLGVPSRLYHLKSPLEIVRDIVYSSISWNAYKNSDVTRAEYRTFKDFIGAIPVDDITNKISIACHCNISVAKKLFNEFLNKIWLYIDGDSIDNEIIRAAISINTELQEKAKTLVQHTWEEENKILLDESQRKLNSICDDLKLAEEKLKNAQEEYNKTKARDAELSSIISKKEQFVNDIEMAISERIQKARENVADFIAEMAFVGGQKIQIESANTVSRTKISSNDEINMYRIHPEYDHSELEAHHYWNDVIETAGFELSEAGVKEQYKRSLAAFLCAAYINKQPLLLVGPNALDIIQAFCAAVTAHKHGILTCEGNNFSQAIERIGTVDENIVIINNLFSSNWANRLPEILSNKNIFYVATHPYAEDIQVEPKSLFGFMLPLFTEPLVNKAATGKYIGGFFASDFKETLSQATNQEELKALSQLSLSSLVKNQINSLASIMHSIYPNSTSDDVFLFCIFPIAYASMEINILSEIISDPHKGFIISSSLKRDLKYILEETNG